MREKDTLDTFNAHGTLAGEFVAAYNDFTSSTIYKKINGEDVIMLYAAPAPLQKKEGFETFYVFSKNSLLKERMTGIRGMIPLEYDVFGEDILEALLDGTKTILSIDGEFYTLSQKALRQISARGGAACDATYKRWNEQTAAHVADAITAADNEINFVIRTADNGAGCVVAALSSSYDGGHDSAIDALKVLTDKVGLPDMLQWQITHDFVKAAVKLPVKTGVEDVDLGVMLMTSDTGFAASTAYTLLRFSRSGEFILTDKFSREHRTSDDDAESSLAASCLDAASAKPDALAKLAECSKTPAPEEEGALKALYLEVLARCAGGLGKDKRIRIADAAIERCDDPDNLFDCAEAIVIETLAVMEPFSETKYRLRKSLSEVPKALLENVK